MKVRLFGQQNLWYPTLCGATGRGKPLVPKCLSLPSALLCFAAQVHPVHLSALRAHSKWSRTSVPGSWLLPSSAIFTWWLWKLPKRDTLPQLNRVRLIANSIANCRVKPLHISMGLARKIAPINEAHCRLVYIQLTLFKHQIICVWLWGQIHPVIFHLSLFYCLACSAELRSYSWSKISLSSLPSFRGLYRCCAKSQPAVNSHHLVVSSSRLRVSRQRAGSSFWLDWLLPGPRNQKLIWSQLGLVKLISQAWSSSRQNLGFDIWREGPDLLYDLPHGIRGAAHSWYAQAIQASLL